MEREFFEGYAVEFVYVQYIYFILVRLTVEMIEIVHVLQRDVMTFQLHTSSVNSSEQRSERTIELLLR